MDKVGYVKPVYVDIDVDPLLLSFIGGTTAIHFADGNNNYSGNSSSSNEKKKKGNKKNTIDRQEEPKAVEIFLSDHEQSIYRHLHLSAAVAAAAHPKIKLVLTSSQWDLSPRERVILIIADGHVYTEAKLQVTFLHFLCLLSLSLLLSCSTHTCSISTHAHTLPLVPPCPLPEV